MDDDLGEGQEFDERRYQDQNRPHPIHQLVEAQVWLQGGVAFVFVRHIGCLGSRKKNRPGSEPGWTSVCVSVCVCVRVSYPGSLCDPITQPYRAEVYGSGIEEKRTEHQHSDEVAWNDGDGVRKPR